MKVSIVLFGVLLACASSYAVDNGPLVTALQPQNKVYVEVPVEEEGTAVDRPKRHLLLGAGLIGAGLIGAKIGLGAGLIGGKLLAAKAFHGRGYGGYYGHGGYYGGGYYGSGYYGGGYYDKHDGYYGDFDGDFW